MRWPVSRFIGVFQSGEPSMSSSASVSLSRTNTAVCPVGVISIPSVYQECSGNSFGLWVNSIPSFSRSAATSKPSMISGSPKSSACGSKIPLV